MLTVAEVTTPVFYRNAYLHTGSMGHVLPTRMSCTCTPCAYAVKKGGSLQVKALALQAHQCEPEFQKGTDSTESFFDLYSTVRRQELVLVLLTDIPWFPDC